MAEMDEHPGPKGPDVKEMTEPYQMQYRWVMLALASFAYFVFSLVTRSLPPLVTPIIRDLNISYSQMGMILGSWPLTYIAVAAIGGAIIDRWGIRKSIFMGILIIGLSEILRSLANGFGTMFVFVALFGLGGPMISIGNPKTISAWFRGRERGKAVGIYTAVSRTGGLIALSTANSVLMPLTGYSWRLTFVCFSLLAFTAALLWFLLAREVTSGEETAESKSTTEVFTHLIRIRKIQIILIMGFLSFAATHGLGSWLPKIFENKGLTPAIAGYMASIPILIGIPMVLLVPRFVAPSLRGRIIALISFGLAVSVLIVVVTPPGILFTTGLLLYGLSFGPAFPLLILILMDIPEVGSRYMGSVAGIFFCVSEIGGFAAPFLIGALKDFTGGFLSSAYVFSGICIAIALMGLSLKIQPVPEPKPH